VTIAALADALSHRGPARMSRLPADVCEHPYGTGLDEARTAQLLALAPAITAQGIQGVPVVRAEPKLRAWVKAKPKPKGPKRRAGR